MYVHIPSVFYVNMTMQQVRSCIVSDHTHLLLYICITVSTDSPSALE